MVAPNQGSKRCPHCKKSMTQGRKYYTCRYCGHIIKKTEHGR